MKKKKFVLITAIIVAVIAIAAVAVLIVDNRTEREAAHEKLISELELPSMLIENEETPSFIENMESLNGYEILSFNTRGEYATARVKVYAPDLYTIAKELGKSAEGLNEEEIMNKVNEAVKDAPIVEREIELTFEKADGEYQPILTSEFLDAYYGGALQLREELLLESVKEGK